MKVKDEIFRQYDIRGIADIDLTDDFAYILGKAFGTHLYRNGFTELVVGRDVRKSSPRLFESLSRGIIDTGCNVIDIGIVPTPLLYFTIFHFDLDGGVMITGSHNPIEYNGFKLMKGKDALYGEEIQKLKQLILKEDFESGRGRMTKKDVVDEYLSYTSSLISPERKLSIIMDPGNGTAGPIATKLFERLGAEFLCINCEPDGQTRRFWSIQNSLERR
jgi:phosphomannomutase/phosphoglucomutase